MGNCVANSGGLPSEFKELPIALLRRGHYQPRRQFDDPLLAELAQSIQTQGLIQPIVVRRATDGYYEIIAGERRWRACQRIGMLSVPCLIYDYNDAQAAAAATIENLQRENLNPIEEAQAYALLMKEFHYSHEQLAQLVGKSRTKITNSLRLLKLDHTVQQLLKDKKISEGHGKLLVSLVNTQAQYALAQQVVKHEWSVRRLEQEIHRLNAPTAVTTDAHSSIQLTQLANALSAYLGSPVSLNYHQGRGSVVIDFYTLEILEGILAKMGFSTRDDEDDG